MVSWIIFVMVLEIQFYTRKKITWAKITRAKITLVTLGGDHVVIIKSDPADVPSLDLDARGAGPSVVVRAGDCAPVDNMIVAFPTTLFQELIGKIKSGNLARGVVDNDTLFHVYYSCQEFDFFHGGNSGGNSEKK
jgi:hypothetical protein